MFDLSKIIFTTILTFVSATSIFSQKIPSLVYDESSGMIRAFYNISQEYSDCAKFKPITGTVKDLSVADPEEETTLSLTLISGKKTESIDFIDLDNYPAHIIGNIKNGLLKKGNNIKIWGIVCGSGGFVTATNIVKVENGTSAENQPEFKDSILNDNPLEASERSQNLRLEIDKKIKRLRDDFDKEIAPNISNEGKGEFETSEEAKIRLTKLQTLRKANISKLWKKIYLETNSLVNEYLKIMSSYYALPIKVSLGRYDADIEWFLILFQNEEIASISVPRKIAQTLKQNFNQTGVFADYDIDADIKRIRIEFDGQIYTDNAFSPLLEYKKVANSR